MKKVSRLTLLLQKSNSIALLFFILTSCSTKFSFNNVVTATIIPKGENIVYNRSAVIKIDNKKVFIHMIEYYDKDLNLLEVDISKAESMLTYSKKELKEDSALIDSYKILLDRKNTSRKNDLISDRNKLYKIMYHSNDTIASIKDDKVLIFINNK